MADNFLDTAERMHDSSKELHKLNHNHNACYLAGYVGECYLKLIVDQTTSLSSPRRYGHDINRMNTALHYFISSSVGLHLWQTILLICQLIAPIFVRGHQTIDMKILPIGVYPISATLFKQNKSCVLIK
jgi:hypothetical protein